MDYAINIIVAAVTATIVSAVMIAGAKRQLDHRSGRPEHTRDTK